jgi:HD-like signal output (HDOD) protein
MGVDTNAAVDRSLFTAGEEKCRVHLPSTSKRALFVDDEQYVLDGLKRTLHSLRTEWQIEFSTSGADALRKLAEREFDVIVTDMRMPGMSGAELLTQVLERYPNTVRIMLSGTVEHDAVLRSAATAHQYLSKPCDATTLRATLDAALRIRSMLASPRLRTLISRMTSLPSLPTVYAELVKSLENEEVSCRELGGIIAKDIGMTVKTLQLANSAFFGLSRHIASPEDAAVYLGVDTIRALTLSTSVFSAFRDTGLTDGLIGQLQRHSMATGTLASSIAKVENLPKKACDSSVIGGFLHDVGKLVLAVNCADEYRSVLGAARDEGRSCQELEQIAFGATHAEIGACLLWLWGLPDAVCKAVAFHHSPAGCSDTTFTAAAAIHAADALEYECLEPENTLGKESIDTEFLSNLRLTDRLQVWRRLQTPNGCKA